MKAPTLFEHDCDSCTSLGVLVVSKATKYDLYFCLQGGKMPTVIARFSDEPADYLSGLGFSGAGLKEAQIRAKALGLI